MKSDQKSDGRVTGRIAIAISVVSFLFTGYQWWNGQRESRINAAVEISRIYLLDPDVKRGYDVFLNYKVSARPSGEFSEEFLRERSYIDFVNYISDLANRDRINNDYLSSRIKCDIAYVVKVVRDQRAELRQAIREAVQYHESGKDADCPDFPERRRN